MERIREITVGLDCSVKQALKKIDQTGKKIVFVVDDRGGLFGVVTDGDIRRWILKDRSLHDNIAKVMNKKPVFLQEGYSLQQAKELMVKKGIECIPVLARNMKVVSALWWADLFNEKFRRFKPIYRYPVVIMAGGEGSRLLPLTNILPKPLLPIGEKPMLEIVMDKFLEYGCKDFYLSLNYKAQIIKAYFNECSGKFNINYIEEDRPLGTIGSLGFVKDIIRKTFFISNCDVLIEADYSDMLKYHKKNRNLITIAVSLKHFSIPYGICSIENGGALKGICEKPEQDHLVNTGFYIAEPKVLDFIPKGCVYHMTDLIGRCLKNKLKVGVYPVSDKSWIDLGQRQELHNLSSKAD
ncbi:MAG: CBS domain-containing protein [Candidatus Omnitrophica bacterium]|nr:CBS domain-containing protein [Candidatus Omnitrophota bacterium]